MQHLSHDQITAMAQPIPRSRDELARLAKPGSAFAIAAADPVLKVAGLNSECVGEGVRFFELSKDDVHAFSCDCSGSISNTSVAGRVRGLKSNVPKTAI